MNQKRLINQHYLNDFIDNFTRRAKKQLGARKIWFGKDRGKYKINSDQYSLLCTLYTGSIAVGGDTSKVDFHD